MELVTVAGENPVGEDIRWSVDERRGRTLERQIEEPNFLFK